MTVPVSACCAVVLNQQQQMIQHHKHCDKARPDHAAKANVTGDDAANSQVMIASDHAVPKQCTVVEDGRVVVKKLPPTHGIAHTDSSKVVT